MHARFRVGRLVVELALPPRYFLLAGAGEGARPPVKIIKGAE
ncbi:hypothetical protein ABZY34_30980 [Streptomyces virginiae]